jgi:hypothetical protein
MLTSTHQISSDPDEMIMGDVALALLTTFCLPPDVFWSMIADVVATLIRRF